MKQKIQSLKSDIRWLGQRLGDMKHPMVEPGHRDILTLDTQPEWKQEAQLDWKNKSSSVNESVNEATRRLYLNVASSWTMVKNDSVYRWVKRG